MPPKSVGPVRAGCAPDRPGSTTKMKKLDRRVELRKHPNHENSCDGQYRPEFGARLLVGKKDFHDVRGKGQSLCSSATLAVDCLQHMCGAGHLNSRRNHHRRYKQEIKIAVLPFSRRSALRVLISFARPALARRARSGRVVLYENAAGRLWHLHIVVFRPLSLLYGLRAHLMSCDRHGAFAV